jgi:hypothetical protein
LREGKLEAENQVIQVLPAEGVGVNLGQILKQYWVLVKGLPLKLSTTQHIQKCLNEVGDILEVDWYNDNWLDSRWMRVKVAHPDISFLHPPQTRFLTRCRKKVKFYTVIFEPDVGEINSNFDPRHQDQTWVAKAREVAESVQLEIFPKWRTVGGAPSVEEHMDLIQVSKAHNSGVQNSFPAEEIANMAAILKRLRGGYNDDDGTEAGRVHKKALTPSVAHRLITGDSDLEILPAPAEEDPSIISLTSSDNPITDSESDREPRARPSSSRGPRSASIPGTLSLSHYY